MNRKQFKRKRTKLGLTQRQVADRLNVRRATISDYETGATKVFRKEKQAFEILGINSERNLNKIRKEIYKALHPNWLTKLINKLNKSWK